MLRADGQRLPGELRPRAEGAKGESVGWRHRWLGEMPSDIEALHAILLLPDAAVPATGAGDVIVLANGDRLEGVITEIGPVVHIDRGGAPETKPSGGDAKSTEAGTEVPIARIAAIGFITPDVAPSGNRLWCADGTIIAATPTMDSETGLLLISRAIPAPSSSQATPTIRSDEILGFAPDPTRVKPLAGIEPREIRTSGETPRGYVERPEVAAGNWPMGLAPITIRGPALVRFPLPARGCAIVAELRVADGDQRWTDFEIVVRDGNREILRQHMDARSNSIALRETLASDELSVELTEGEQGPIRDAIEIRRALVVLPSH